MKTTKILATIVACLICSASFAKADLINIGDAADGGIDASQVGNWTTNDTAFVDPQPGPTNGGLAFNWENVTANTSTADVPNNEFDFVMTSNINHVIGHGYLMNESFDLSTATNGIEGMRIDFDFNASANTNWSPLISVDGTLYRWNHSANSFNGNGALTGNTFLQNTTLNATNSTWGELVDTAGGWGSTRIGGTNPDLQAATGIVQFGFIQWGAATGGAANITNGTLAIDEQAYGITFTSVPEPTSLALFGIGLVGLGAFDDVAYSIDTMLSSTNSDLTSH